MRRINISHQIITPLKANQVTKQKSHDYWKSVYGNRENNKKYLQKNWRTESRKETTQRCLPLAGLKFLLYLYRTNSAKFWQRNILNHSTLFFFWKRKLITQNGDPPLNHSTLTTILLVFGSSLPRDFVYPAKTRGEGKDASSSQDGGWSKRWYELKCKYPWIITTPRRWIKSSWSDDFFFYKRSWSDDNSDHDNLCPPTPTSPRPPNKTSLNPIFFFFFNLDLIQSSILTIDCLLNQQLIRLPRRLID